MYQKPQPFVDLPYLAPTAPNPNAASVLNSAIGGPGNFSELLVGAGSKAFHTDSSGSWWGALKFADAPASIDMLGAIKAANITITGGTILGVPMADIADGGSTDADAVPTGLTVSGTGITVAPDGTVSAYVTLTWNAIATSTFDRYQIRYKKAVYTYYQYTDTKVNTITIDGLLPNTSYNFGAASINKAGFSSAFCASVTQTTAADNVPPADVVAGTATGGIQYVIVQWTHNTEKDLASYNIYRNTTADSATAALIGNCRTNYFIDGGRTGGVTYYYWLKALDTSGNLSVAFSNSMSATPRNVASVDSSLSHMGWVQTCPFTSTDADTVSWGAGVFTSSAGISYNIIAGNTGNMLARTFIYLDISVSSVSYQVTTTPTSAVGDNKILIGVAENNTGGATLRMINSDIYMDGSDLVAASITSDRIAANTIVAGNIAAGTISATEIDTASITSLTNLALSASQILINGTVYLSNWRHGTDLTKIDGGNIYTGSVTTTQLNFTPVQSTDVIAKINASLEGITITAENLTIGAATTFSAGYDPTGKVAGVGGAYDSAASGARVRIFPDSSTGIQVIDDVAADVFKVLVGGVNVGDVIIGNYAGGQGIFYDKSANTTTFKGALSAATGTFTGSLSGATITGATGTFSGSMTVGGFHITATDMNYYNGAAYKFVVCFTDASPLGDAGDVFIGNAGAKYISWDDSLGILTVQGTLRTAAPGAGVGSSVSLTGGANEMIHLFHDATETGTIKGYTTEGSEVTYIEIAAVSGRKMRFKKSFIEVSGNFLPTVVDAYTLGSYGMKWSEVWAGRLLQSTPTDGTRHCHSFAYVEMGLIPQNMQKKYLKGEHGCMPVDGIPSEDIKLPFKKGTVLIWKNGKLQESEKDNDQRVIATADHKGLPIVLGAEPVRVVGKVKCGDYIVSAKNGCGKVAKNPDQNIIIGKALEGKKTSKESLIKVMIKF